MTVKVWTEKSARKLAEQAALIAIGAHGGDRNKHDGEIYLAHVARVAFGARRQAAGTDVMATVAEAVGWLHDVVEDTVLTLNQVRDMLLEVCQDEVERRMVEAICVAVGLLTKTKGEPNIVYYKRVKTNELATVVKKSDMLDNFRRNHKIVNEADRARMGKKYSEGMDYLNA